MIKIVLLAKNYTQKYLSGRGFLLKYFKIRCWKSKLVIFLKTCHHFKLKDIKVYLEDILGLNLINFVSLDLKLHDKYCHTIYLVEIVSLQLLNCSIVNSVKWSDDLTVCEKPNEERKKNEFWKRKIVRIFSPISFFLREKKTKKKKRNKTKFVSMFSELYKHFTLITWPRRPYTRHSAF